MSKGIDYGRGLANVDTKTGIRFGVIPANAVGQAWFDAAESDYGEPSCPKCGNEVEEIAHYKQKGQVGEHMLADYEGDDWEHKGCGWDFACHKCKLTLDSDRVYADEPRGQFVKDDELFAHSGEVDIFVERSLYFTRAAFCSPCAPGACYLTQSCDDGERAYCFGHEWFDEGKAPYRVFRVDTGEEVFPPS